VGAGRGRGGPGQRPVQHHSPAVVPAERRGCRVSGEQGQVLGDAAEVDDLDPVAVPLDAEQVPSPGGRWCTRCRLPPQARLTVETGGRILDAGEIRELAQPFRRLAPDRTGSDNGTGLGLSIVAAIAATHHGTLDLHARPQGGLRVIIELPAAAQTVMAGLPS
jgi:signal transduction histidine kinase